jgi:hypothetical protein
MQRPALLLPETQPGEIGVGKRPSRNTPGKHYLKRHCERSRGMRKNHSVHGILRLPQIIDEAMLAALSGWFISMSATYCA